MVLPSFLQIKSSKTPGGNFLCCIDETVFLKDEIIGSNVHKFFHNIFTFETLRE